jgi:hypothetical protein
MVRGALPLGPPPWSPPGWAGGIHASGAGLRASPGSKFELMGLAGTARVARGRGHLLG